MIRPVVIIGTLTLGMMVLLMERVIRLRDHVDAMAAQEEETKKKAEELRKSSEALNTTVQAFITEQVKAEAPPTGDDLRVFDMLVEARCMDSKCPPDSRTRCGPALLHWEHGHFREPGLDCLYDGGTVKSCPGACP